MESPEPIDIRFVADEVFDRFEGIWTRQEIQERKDALVQQHHDAVQHQRFMENLIIKYPDEETGKCM